MKKIIVLTLVLALVAGLCACFKDKASIGEQSTESESVSQESGSETTFETTPSLSEIPLELYSVEIKQETIDTGSYLASLIYPQVTGYSDIEIEEKVNAIIYSYVTRKLNTAVAETGAQEGIEYRIDSFNVTYKGDKLISALCRGSVSAEASAYSENFAYGINIDLKSAKLIGFDSIVDYDGFKNDFSNDAYKIVYGYPKLLEETNCKDMIEQYDPLYSIYPEFYIKDTVYGVNLGIIVDTVQVHGDVAEFEEVIEDKKYVKEYFAGLLDEKAPVK